MGAHTALGYIKLPPSPKVEQGVFGRQFTQFQGTRAAGTEDWQAWILSRQANITYSESIRPYGNNSAEIAANLMRARQQRNMSVAVANPADDIARTQEGKVVVLLHCKQCMKYGLIRNRQTANTVRYCPFSKSGSRKVTTATDLSQVVVYPWQLLSNPTFRLHLHQSLVESNDELWQHATMDDSSVLGLEAASTAGQDPPEDISWITIQLHIAEIDKYG